jgi:protein-tyrosine kinase
MSRIHDALRKAEEERAATNAAQPAVPPPPAATAPVAERSPAATVGAPLPATAPLPSTAPPPAARAAAAAPAPQSLEAALDPLHRARTVSWKPDLKACLPFHSKQRLGTEEFRTLRSRLYQFRDRQPLKTLLVGSALPGEGKTFVSVNLSQVIAQQHECRVLLIDADLRWPRVHLSLGAPLTPGLTEYLAGKADEFSIVQKGSINNLFFIPGGKAAENPSDLLGTDRLGRLLARMEPFFDWIIVDSPPAVPVSDASVMSELCDGVLLVISSGNTSYGLAQKAQREFHQKPVVGVVLNRVSAHESYGSYYYGYYGQVESSGK